MSLLVSRKRYLIRRGSDDIQGICGLCQGRSIWSGNIVVVHRVFTLERWFDSSPAPPSELTLLFPNAAQR